MSSNNKNRRFSELEVFTPTQPQRKKGWTDKQWQQSQNFWAKKNPKDADKFYTARMLKMTAPVKKELTTLSSMNLVSRFKENPMPDAKNPINGAPGATRHYKDVMHDVSQFLDPKAPVRSTFNEGGPQFIQQVNNSLGRRVGIDVEPSNHVETLKPHLNLQTQLNNTVVTKKNQRTLAPQHPDLSDPHHPVASFDPFQTSGVYQKRSISSNPNTPFMLPQAAHPLQGKLTSDERRAFAERYLRSLDTPVSRDKK